MKAEDDSHHVRVFRYVTHSQVEAYLSQGWIIASLLGQPHAEYSVLMELPPWPAAGAEGKGTSAR